MTKNILYILTVALALILIVPAIQTATRVFGEPKLGGYVAPAQKPTFSPGAFMSNQFQDKTELYQKRTFGLRAWFIRCYNQYQFWLFKKTNADGLIHCGHNLFIGKGYIDAFNGTNYIGYDSINRQLTKLKLIREHLQAQHKDILVVIAASKGTFFSQNIPPHLLNQQDTNNYRAYTAQLKHKGIPFIDFNALFLKWKDTTQYPIYARLGVHWSDYGGYLVADSLVKYIEQTQHLDLPDMVLEHLKLSKPKGPDKDISDGLNLVFNLKSEKYAYPILSYNTHQKDSLSVLIVGDSFFYNLANTNFHNKVFTNSEFWFYNKGRYKDPPFDATGLNQFKADADKFDYYILLANEATLHSFAWRFIDDYYAAINTCP